MLEGFFSVDEIGVMTGKNVREKTGTRTYGHRVIQSQAVGPTIRNVERITLKTSIAADSSVGVLMDVIKDVNMRMKSVISTLQQ